MKNIVVRFVVGAGLILSIQGNLEAQDEFNGTIALRHVKRANNTCSAAFKSFLKVSKALENGNDVSEDKLTKAIDKLTDCSEMIFSLADDADAAIAQLSGDDEEEDPIDEDPGDEFEDESSKPLTAAGRKSKDDDVVAPAPAPVVPAPVVTAAPQNAVAIPPVSPPQLPNTTSSLYPGGLANNDPNVGGDWGNS